MSKRWISMSKGKEGSSLKKLAAGSLTFVKAYSNGQANTAIDSLEDELERELERERKSVPTSGFARLRHKGGKILRSKHVLLLIVVLNVIDCALVLGELVLDLNHVKDILTAMEQSSTAFHERLKEKYPGEFEMTKMDNVYQKVLQAHMHWENERNSTNQTEEVGQYVARNSGSIAYLNTVSSIKRHTRTLLQTIQESSSSASKSINVRTKRSGDFRDQNSAKISYNFDDKHESAEEIIAKIFHSLSICIVCILLTETILKVLCFGKHFFTQKLEVFDAVIVAASFIVDFVFLGGMTIYTIQEFVFILAFMLPWGVIRVVNSLVVAVRDHEHFRLKLLYTQKKKIDNDNKQLRQEKERSNEQVDALRRLCLVEGIDEWKVQQSISRQVMRPGKGIMGSFASLALGALGGTRSNGASIWNLLGTPKLRRGKSEEWEGKLGVKEDTRSLRYSDRVWTVVGTSEYKKSKKQNSVPHQSTVDSDPGTPTAIRGKLKALKRLLRRQEPVDATSFSSIDTVDKDSKCSIDKMTSSDNSSPPQSFDDYSADELEIRVSAAPTCDIIDECSIETSRCDSRLSISRKEGMATPNVENRPEIRIESDNIIDKNISGVPNDNMGEMGLGDVSQVQDTKETLKIDTPNEKLEITSSERTVVSRVYSKEDKDTNAIEQAKVTVKQAQSNKSNKSAKSQASINSFSRPRLFTSKSYNNVSNVIDENWNEKVKIKRTLSTYLSTCTGHRYDSNPLIHNIKDNKRRSMAETDNHTKV